MRGNWGNGAVKVRYEGAINSMMRRMRETQQSEDMRQYYQRFLSHRPCSACGETDCGLRRSGCRSAGAP